MSDADLLRRAEAKVREVAAGLIVGACVPSLVALVSVPERWGDA